MRKNLPLTAAHACMHTPCRDTLGPSSSRHMHTNTRTFLHEHKLTPQTRVCTYTPTQTHARYIYQYQAMHPITHSLADTQAGHVPTHNCPHSGTDMLPLSLTQRSTNTQRGARADTGDNDTCRYKQVYRRTQNRANAKITYLLTQEHTLLLCFKRQDTSGFKPRFK